MFTFCASGNSFTCLPLTPNMDFFHKKTLTCSNYIHTRFMNSSAIECIKTNAECFIGGDRTCTPLEIHGKGVYIRGSLCHSRRPETNRNPHDVSSPTLKCPTPTKLLTTFYNIRINTFGVSDISDSWLFWDNVVLRHAVDRSDGDWSIAMSLSGQRF